MNIRSPKFLYSIAIILGGVGSIIFGFTPIIGSILIMIGVLGGIWSFLEAESKNKQGDYLFDAQAVLLAKHGAGNIYAEAVKLELKKTGSSQNAKQLLLKALDIEPNNLDALEILCPLLALNLSFSKWLPASSKESNNQQTLELAKKLTARGLELAPERHVFHDAKGIIYDFEGKHNKARKEFSISSSLRTDPYWHLLFATSWHMSGEHEKALTEMEKARSKGACGWLFDFYYGQALQAVGDYEKALKYLENTIKQTGWKVEPLHFLSDTHFSIGNYLKAAKYKGLTGIAIITLSYKTGVRYLLESVLHLFVGLACNFSKLIWKFTKFIPIFRTIQFKFIPPFEPELSIGYSLIEKKHFAAAEKLFRRACAIVPEWSETHSNLAICLAMQGKKKEAIESIDRAITLDPKNEAYNWNKEQFVNEKSLNIRKI